MRNYKLDKICKKEELDTIIETMEEDSLVFASDTNEMFVKKEGKAELFIPEEVVAREDNSMIIKFPTYLDFVKQLADIPDGSAVYIEESNAIWKKDGEYSKFKGTPESLGMKVK